MPRRDDIRKILIIGSGPIVIGQAAEFDYAGVQACKVLAEEGYEVVLVNSNPATIMTDPEFASATYVEPLTPETIEAVIARERPDALLGTLGGQTALNLSKTMHEHGVLERYGVELIGADYEAISRAEDRELFRKTVIEAGLKVPRSEVVTSIAQADRTIEKLGLPIIVRPAFTLGGHGGGIAFTQAEFAQRVSEGLNASPISQVLLEQSLLGWGEFELEVMRDRNDNALVVCSIENVDPMGVHTGDSVTVAPQQTLTDRAYQELRDQALAVIRAVGVETGGSNIQFAVDPATGNVVVIEMNPRVSRSSALASKATGFPIAKIAARLAVGYALEEIPNDITRRTPASFEPAIDYAVVKIPRFAFEKFPHVEGGLTTQMKSVGEAMAIGRTFKQAFMKALRSRELDSEAQPPQDSAELLARLGQPSHDRYELLLEALRRGSSIEELNAYTRIDPWFLRQFAELVEKGPPAGKPSGGWSRDELAGFKDLGYSDEQAGVTRDERLAAGLRPSFRSVDTCAAEFEAETPYFYSAYERTTGPRPSRADGSPPQDDRSEIRRGSRASVVILGSGPNRIGQGIEFDYCCVHAAMTVREMGRDAVMINCNPETVSTDYDTSDRLYFEPLTVEDVLEVVEAEQPEGAIVQFGGQTPLRIAEPLIEAGVKLLGTPVDAIDLAEDRGRFGAVLDELEIKAPPYGIATGPQEARNAATQVGFPLLVRPSYVLGGRAMELCYTQADLEAYLERMEQQGALAKRMYPLLLDRFLENAIELDVDALADGSDAYVAGIMQHVEEAGVHSGDSACVLPPLSLGAEMLSELRRQTRALALRLGVVGLVNVQFALVDNDQLYVIEANPRASRTVPFVSKAIGVPLAKVACRLILGERLRDQQLPSERAGSHVSVKEAVLPFQRLQGSDALLGPEMKSTGEVMGIAQDFPTAFGKVQAAAGVALPAEGSVFISVCDTDKPAATQLAARMHDLGFKVLATRGTAQAIRRMGIPVEPLNKIGEGSPHVVDRIRGGDVGLVINTPVGRGARTDGWEIRRAAVEHGVPCVTTMTGASAAARAIDAQRMGGEATVRSLQELHGAARASAPGGTPGQTPRAVETGT
ncbi:MAG: carbamoyl-phosphate synthase large subunit [Solirubrobacterales bacterium]